MSDHPTLPQMFGLPFGWNDPFSREYIGEERIEAHEDEYQARTGIDLNPRQRRQLYDSDMGIFEGYGEHDERYSADEHYGDNPVAYVERDERDDYPDEEERAESQRILQDQRVHEQWERRNPSPSLGDILAEAIMKGRGRTSSK